MACGNKIVSKLFQSQRTATKTSLLSQRIAIPIQYEDIVSISNGIICANV